MTRLRRRSLPEIARKLNTTKGKSRLGSGRWTSLAEVYEPLLAPLRARARTVLEIGVENGGSVQMWAKYFPKAQVWGVDINESASRFEKGRIKIRIGDQSDGAFLEGLLEQTGDLDLVVDDGSHEFDDQRSTLLTLWPHLRRGGVYIVEDIHTSYRPTYGGALGQAGTFAEFLKGLIDDVHQKEHLGEVTLDALASIHIEYQTAVLSKAPLIDKDQPPITWQDVPTVEDVRRMRAYADEGHVFTVLIALMATLGLRPGETCALRTDDFDLEAMTVRISRSANKDVRERPTNHYTNRTLPVPDDVRDVVAPLLATPGFLFPARDQDGDLPCLSIDALTASFERMRDSLGLSASLQPNALRRYAATQLLASDSMSRQEIAAFLGVEDVARLERYPTG